jgi:hypothetical protein
MAIVQWISPDGIIDISELVTRIEWSGDSQSASRSLDLGILASPNDYYLPVLDVKLGQMLKLITDDGIELFSGYIFTLSKGYNENEMTVKAYDGLIYLLKSKEVYNFKGVTPEYIAKKVCDDYGIPIGDLYQSGVKINKIFDSSTLYDIIMTAYTEAYLQDGMKYYACMDKGKLLVIQNGEYIPDVVLSNYDTQTGEGTVTDTTFSGSLENMVNRVKIINEKGAEVKTVESADDLQYGVIQDIYKLYEGEQVPIAESMLVPVEWTGSVRALGHIECITGNGVMIEDQYTGLVGQFVIESDSHVWQDGLYTMTLRTNMNAMIDKTTAGKRIQTAKSKKKRAKKAGEINLTAEQVADLFK